MRLFVLFFTVLYLHWSYAAVLRKPIGGIIGGQPGECPVYPFRCLIACVGPLEGDSCANKGANCCTSDCQCKPTQKCCQPACGCNKVCTDVVSTLVAVESDTE